MGNISVSMTGDFEFEAFNVADPIRIVGDKLYFMYSEYTGEDLRKHFLHFLPYNCELENVTVRDLFELMKPVKDYISDIFKIDFDAYYLHMYTDTNEVMDDFIIRRDLTVTSVFRSIDESYFDREPGVYLLDKDENVAYKNICVTNGIYIMEADTLPASRYSKLHTEMYVNDVKVQGHLTLLDVLEVFRFLYKNPQEEIEHRKYVNDWFSRQENRFGSNETYIHTDDEESCAAYAKMFAKENPHLVIAYGNSVQILLRKGQAINLGDNTLPYEEVSIMTVYKGRIITVYKEDLLNKGPNSVPV